MTRRATPMTRSPILPLLSGLLLSGVLLSGAALAQRPAPSAAEQQFAACLKRGQSQLDSAACYADHSERLRATQASLLQQIRAKLARPGPEGTDYAAAGRQLEAAQAAWQAYLEADCRLIEPVFGGGNAEGMAEAECEIEHYTQRNRSLAAFKSAYLD